MLKVIFNKDDSFFLKNNLASPRGAPQGNGVKFRFAIHSQGLQRQYIVVINILAFVSYLV